MPVMITQRAPITLMENSEELKKKKSLENKIEKTIMSS